MTAISAILIIAALAGVGYCVWRLVRRQRGHGDPEGHPRLRIIGAATIAALAIGTVLAPAEESDPEPVAQEQVNGDAERERQEAERARRDAEAREREARKAEERERAEAERRRRAAQGKTARVTRVIDGDTVELEGVGRVRLIGVDTPERGEECFDEATAYLRGRVGGKTVRYRYQEERTDRYDRALLDLFRGGQLINLDIAEAGWGEELTIAPNDRYADRIRAAEQDARAAPRGRWAGCAAKSEPKREPSAPPPPSEDEDDSSGSSGGLSSAPPYPPDVDCGDLSGPVAVGPDDPHGLDGDGDGVGCD